MKVTATKLTNEALMQLVCGFTINKASKMSLDKIYQCMHSPIRTQLFLIEMFDIYTFVSTHLVRHSVGVTHYVKSNREDRIGYTGDGGRLHPVNHAMFINAEALINMSKKRLCTGSHKYTIETMQAIKDAVALVDPFLPKYMVRDCEFRNGKCPELKCCGNLWRPNETY